MNPNQISKTALSAAALRVIENMRPKQERMFEDKLALIFLKPVWRIVMQLFRLRGFRESALTKRDNQYPGVMGGLLCRTRFIDDTLRKSLTDGFEQIIILGAGFDTRPYRIEGIDKVRVFEVDHPPTMAWKIVSLKKKLKNLPQHVGFVPVNFNKQKLSDEMIKSDYNPGLKSLFIWEGVTQYITAEAVDETFKFIRESSPAGSRIVFTYVDQNFLDKDERCSELHKILSDMENLAEPWVFGIHQSEIGGFLEQRGFKLIEQVGSDEYDELYLKQIDRTIKVFDIEKVVVAELA